jgi:epoxyqueuosine reductase
MQETENGAWVERLASGFIAESPENTLASAEREKKWVHEKAWADPLVGFANGADPIFKDFKEHVGDFHWTPAEIFSQTFPHLSISSDELTVISWILPQTEPTKIDSRKASRIPPERWNRSRIFGEKTNEKLRLFLVEKLNQAGYAALAPTLTPNWEIVRSERFYLASKWSERHAAFAAGLGTFGLCDGLITAKGKAIRAGSVIAKINIPPTPRPYQGHRAYCLYFSENTCGECIERCPVGALSENGHDKRKCNRHIQNNVAAYVKENFGFPGRGGCGLCQTGVPCESEIPPSKKE